MFVCIITFLSISITNLSFIYHLSIYHLSIIYLSSVFLFIICPSCMYAHSYVCMYSCLYHLSAIHPSIHLPNHLSCMEAQICLSIHSAYVYLLIYQPISHLFMKQCCYTLGSEQERTVIPKEIDTGQADFAFRGPFPGGNVK